MSIINHGEITCPLPGISVVIPCYNREVFLREAIESVLSQGYTGPLEIVVVDDGSTDESLEVASSFGPPVLVVPKPKDCPCQGPGPTRNRGIAASSQPLIALLDSDDLFLPGHLERLAGALTQEPEVMLVFDESMIFCDGVKSVFPYPNPLMTNPCASIMLLEPLPQTSALMFRRDVLRDIGEPFDASLLYGEDNDFRLRIAEKHPVRFVPGYGSMIREHGHRSIRTCQAKVLYENDMLFVKKATTRHRYPSRIVRFKKAKIIHAFAMSHWRERKRLFAFLGFLRASLTAPELALTTIYRWLLKKLSLGN
jgi:glycosyltransferase involved in cell wall biosynthesis